MGGDFQAKTLNCFCVKGHLIMGWNECKHLLTHGCITINHSCANTKPLRGQDRYLHQQIISSVILRSMQMRPVLSDSEQSQGIKLLVGSKAFIPTARIIFSFIFTQLILKKNTIEPTFTAIHPLSDTVLSTISERKSRAPHQLVKNCHLQPNVISKGSL